MFVTLEDETGIANLVLWAETLEKYHRVVLSASMVAVRGRIQREGEVVHLLGYHLADLSRELASVGEREAVFLLPRGRGDEFHYAGAGLDPRGRQSKGPAPRDISVPDSRVGSIRAASRGFR